MKKSIKIFFPMTVIFLVLLFVGTAFAAGDKITVRAENRAEGVYLEWNAVDGAYYYEVYRQAGAKGKKLLLSKVQSTAYEDSEAKEGTSYIYTVVPTFQITAWERQVMPLRFTVCLRFISQVQAHRKTDFTLNGKR